MSAVKNNYLEGKTAVVTGGCGGIGSAICERFLREGAIVYAVDIAESLVDGAIFQKHDVTSEDSAKALMRRVENEQGKLDILVNAAAIEIEYTIENTRLEDRNTKKIVFIEEVRERLALKGADNVNFQSEYYAIK